ncbi:DUF4956 domain-containing protein [Mycetocola reblochoni]|uniref:DUF4956 domain-containing protein n=2 Tax=Mycetocola reblochoni TaxID=331618 RepID=A0A1R4JHR9_9MICO|nr:DUF4956 domain-containing protein [Mycetocola reblochoni]RLP70523.1 DUF4956 domain-containing protein [Mycetocola reblochoni]SJN31781.1 hypothetical protein FM119_07695 [Mycetocola reblochoni REB411]
MTSLVPVLADLAAIAVLTFGLYFPRHRRRDLVVAFLCVNVGVLALTQVLAASSLGAGLGLGLFGVLSIIRLRSSEIAQHEVAYYFSALALGLIAGLGTGLGAITYVLMGLVLLAVLVGDAPALFRSYRQSTITLDRAIADEEALRRHLAEVLGARVRRVSVVQLDLVNDTTIVDVRYQLLGGAGAAVLPSDGATGGAHAVAGPRPGRADADTVAVATGAVGGVR